MARTYVYIDGFNLYYRLLKKAPQYRWLDIAKSQHFFGTSVQDIWLRHNSWTSWGARTS